MSDTASPALAPSTAGLPHVQAMLQELGQLLPPHPQASIPRAKELLGQVSQALAALALAAPSRLAQSMAATLARPVPDAASAAKTVQLLQLARGDLLRHLDGLAQKDTLAEAESHATSHQQLFESYRALERLGGKDSAHPIDLWQPQGQASLAQLPAALLPPMNGSSIEQLRTRLDQGVLAWVKSAAPDDAAHLRQLCLQLASNTLNPALASIWQLASAWLDALAHKLLVADVYAKRLAARLLMQLSQQAKGQLKPLAQTQQELLFFCDLARQHPQAQPLPPLLHAICQSCQLIPSEPQADSSAGASAKPAPNKTTSEPEPTSAPAILEIKPEASLLQGLAATPQQLASEATLFPAQDLAQRLRNRLKTWMELPAAEALEHNAVESLLALSEQLTRYAWEAGWAEISTLADRLQRIWQRLPLAEALPQRLPQDCLHACDELLRLLHQLSQGFMRRAQSEVVQALEQWLLTLPAPPAPPEPEPAPPAPPEPEPLPQAPTTPTPLEPLHFAVLEEEVQVQWPQLQAALEAWQAASSPATAPSALLRALHTLKGSARLSGALDWAAQVHALESLALEPEQTAAALAQPVEALRLAFTALQQEMDLRHPQRQQASPHSEGQSLDSLQRHAQALLASHEQGQRYSQDGQTALAELHTSLQGLRQSIQDCHVWADTLMLHGGLDMAEQTYEWHQEISDLVQQLLAATDDIGTIERQLQHHHGQSQQQLAQHSGHLRALQHSLLYASQRPFSSIEARLQECLRLAAQDSGKPAQLHISGGALRLAKTSLQALAPVLEHVLRNSLAHGIEAPTQRRVAGKPEQGQLQLRLSQQDSTQTLVLQDDGAGLDLAAIGQQAHAMGLWPDTTTPSVQEAAALVLQPGLSTAPQLSELAGRGIGLDAVQAQIQALGGQLHIDSHSGQGCRFTITLPAPPQVEQIIALRAGNWRVALPAHYVQGQRRVPHSLIAPALQQAMLRGDASGPLPLYWAGALWQQSQHSQEPPLDGQCSVLLLRSPTQRWGLVVDEILPTQEVVLQAASGLHTPIPGLLGTAIQPSGQVLQVYDPEAVITAHEQRLRQHPQAAPTTAAPNSAEQERPLIMLVDDSISVRRLAQHLLNSHGWRVTTAANGLEALEQLENGLLPDLLLVDIEMPDMNGLELLRRLREHPLWQSLPVVMLTAHEAGPVSQQALDMGAQAYLTKPYSPPQLLAQVARYAAAAPVIPNSTPQEAV